MRYGILIVFFFCNILLFAQQQSPVFITYTAANGLSQSNINNVQLDKKGLLWIATNYGLNHFDGYNFSRYYLPADNKQNGLSGNKINQVLCDSFLVWAAIENGGVSCYFDMAGYFMNYVHKPSDANSLISDDVNCLLRSSSNQIFIGTEAGLSILNRINSRFVNIVNHPVTQQPLHIKSLVQSADGYVWIGTKEQGLLYCNKSMQLNILQNAPHAITVSVINSLLYDDTYKTLYVCTSTGLWSVKLEENNVSWGQPIKELRQVSVECIEKDKQGDLWIGTTTQGLYNWDKKNTAKHYVSNGTRNGLISNCIKNIFFQPDGAAWISTPKGLQFYYPDFQRFPVYKQYPDHEEKGGAAMPYALCAKGKYLIAMTTGSVVINDTGFSERLHLSIPVSNGRPIQFTNITTIDGNIYVTSKSGLYQLLLNNDKASFNRPEKILQVYNKIPCTDIIKVDEKKYWLAADKKIYFLNATTTKLDSIAPFNDKDNRITKLYKDRSGNILVGLSNGLVSYTAENDFAKHISTSINAIPNFYVNDILDDGANIWIATSTKGLYKCDKKLNIICAYTIDDGLCDNTVYCIQPDEKGNLWLTTKRGLSFMDKSSATFFNYYESDGLASNEFSLFGKVLYNGAFYFSNTEGIMKIRPYGWTMTERKKLPITLSRIKVDNKALSETDLLMLNETKTYEIEYKQNVILSFRAISFTDQKEVMLQYKLNDNGNWSDVASGAEILLQSLTPGNYKLYIRHKNINKDEEAEVTFLLKVKPLWYQRWWFYLLALITVAAIVYWSFQLRLKQQLKIYEVRDRISRDLHDEVGATLSGLSMYSNLTKAQMKAMQISEVERSLDIMQNSATSMVDKLNDIVWLVNPQYDALSMLIEKLEEYAIEMGGVGNMKIQVDIPSYADSIKLEMNQRRNTFLICKEAINNAAKYSGATVLNLDVAIQDQVMRCVIKDNGKGFDKTKIKPGNGLANMQKRANEMNAQLDISSSIENGTVVSVECKIT